MATLAQPDTPFAVLDTARLDRNIARLRGRLRELDVPLRFHVKTAKSLDVTARVHPDGPEPITVSTLAEAEYFADAGYTDILYAVGIDPHKLSRVLRLHRRGVEVAVLLDSVAQAQEVAAASRQAELPIPAMIEIDCDGTRGGVLPDDPLLIAIGRTLHDGGAQLSGVLDHAGGSYSATTMQGREAAAEAERQAVIRAAQALRDAALPCPGVSVGSTPTALAAATLAGVTEVRAGTFVFQDLVMAGVGVCDLDEIALSIAVTVIGHRPDKGWIVTDGGWMAVSRDRGTADQRVDQGYGLVCDLAGRVIPDLLVSGTFQEHGVLSARLGSAAALPDLPVGTRLRILPNHACATAAQHERYSVVAGLDDSAEPAIERTWPRLNGW